MVLPNRFYDLLKWVTQIVLPGLGTLYFSLAAIWGLPYGEQVVGTITAVVLFLGLVLGLSTLSYNKDGQRFEGDLNFITDPETGSVKPKFEFNRHPVEMKDQKEVVFKVNPPAPQ